MVASLLANIIQLKFIFRFVCSHRAVSKWAHQAKSFAFGTRSDVLSGTEKSANF